MAGLCQVGKAFPGGAAPVQTSLISQPVCWFLEFGSIWKIELGLKRRLYFVLSGVRRAHAQILRFGLSLVVRHRHRRRAGSRKARFVRGLVDKRIDPAGLFITKPAGKE